MPPQHAVHHAPDAPRTVSAQAPASAEEASRLAALRHYAVLDTAPEPAFDRIADLARTLFGAPTALVSLVDETRQWFKARRGIDLPETPRDWSFCAHAILSDEPLVVPDTHRDRRFADNPLVTGGPHIRFYAGAPVITSAGLRLGTVCIAAQEPRPDGMSVDDAARLAALAAMVAEALELRLRGRLMAEAVAERTAALARAEAELAERDLMAREADHRVKNELQRLHSLLSMQIAATQEAASRQALEAAARRVLAIAAAHRHLHDVPNAGDAAGYLAALVADLARPEAAARADRPIELDAAAGLIFPAALLSRLGLIAAELVSNSLKHGAGRVRVTLRPADDGQGVILCVSDEGRGFPHGFDFAARRTSLGMRLVSTLAGRGNVAVDADDPRRILVRLATEPAAARPPSQA